MGCLCETATAPSKIKIKNFRLLKDTKLDLKEDISLLIGKNNTGKTSFLVLLENFFNSTKFHYNDFPVSVRKEIKGLNKDTNVDELSIQLIIEIQYDEDDNLEVLSEFMLDLDPEIKNIKILFECKIKKDALLQKIEAIEPNEKEKFIEKNLHKFLKTKIYAFDDSQHLDNENFFIEFKNKLIEKDLKKVTDLINVQIIHARRNVASSEDGGNKKGSVASISESEVRLVFRHNYPAKAINCL